MKRAEGVGIIAHGKSGRCTRGNGGFAPINGGASAVGAHVKDLQRLIASVLHLKLCQGWYVPSNVTQFQVLGFECHLWLS